MKSIEEKAKAYDEAVINGSRLWECGEITRESYEYIFPELAESEDERIRKALIEGFKVMKDGSYGECTFSNYNIPVTAIIAWLEKQGEHANFLSKIQIGDKVTRNKDGVLVNLSQLNRVAKKDEKQGKQKPADWFQELEDKLANATPEQLAEWKEKYFKEEPAEWSEEDEEIHRRCICAMRASACGFPEEVKFVEQVDNWLESLKDRVQPQPKQEWSEKDEGILQTVINRLELLKNRNASEIPYVERCVEWLKSLKERYTWKPSDEQMDAINDAIDYLGGNTKIVRKHLMSLYEQLKKLKA